MNNVSQKQEKIYFGLDISQKTIEIFALKGEKGVSFGKISNNQKSLTEFFDKVPVSAQSITVALETGTHSAWISRLLEERGYEIIVAHARDLAFIYKGDKKSDRIDAEKLARMARADKKLLHPVQLMDRKRQEDLIAIKARDLLVRQRTNIINSIRGFVRSLGIEDVEYSHETINQMYELLPHEVQQNLRGLFEILTAINTSINVAATIASASTKVRRRVPFGTTIPNSSPRPFNLPLPIRSIHLAINAHPNVQNAIPPVVSCGKTGLSRPT